MNLWPNKRHKSARALIIRDGKLLVFLRKRHSKKNGEWIEYYSIPGGGIDKNETPENAVVRELYEEMGVRIELSKLVAHRIGKIFEHYVFMAHIISGEPHLMMDSEEADLMSSRNQFIVEWVPVESLTKENLRYYSDYLDLIRALAKGNIPDKVIDINAR